MPRTLNPEYLRRIMQKDVLRGLEAVLLTGPSFGVEIQHPDKNESEAVNLRRGSSILVSMNYRGWSIPGKLYCAKCWSALIGIPKEIVMTNWCDRCRGALYDHQDDARFDFLGNQIYRDRVNRLTRIAAITYRELIGGAECIAKSGQMQEGYHKDHIYSVREGFECNLDEAIVASPVNIRAVHGKQNLSKNRKCDMSVALLQTRYDAFLAAHPHWQDQVRKSDESEPTFTIADHVDKTTGQAT